MELNQLHEKWNELKKAINHKASIASMSASKPEAKQDFPKIDSSHLKEAKYGSKNIPGAGPSLGTSGDNIGYVKSKDQPLIVRHGSAAHRTAVEHAMAKLLGADHMLPEQSYDPGMHHPEHNQKPTFEVDKHGGSSIQGYVDGDSIHDAIDSEKKMKPLIDQWKSGDLHKLWALHYISNNGDMHSGNFKITKDGVKAFDSSQAFHELPFGHAVEDYGDGPKVHYLHGSYSQLPSYLTPFVSREDNDEGISAKHSDEQPNFEALRQHANMINPEAFLQYGKHAAERAMKVKEALMSSDPTKAMTSLWDSHHDKTGDSSDAN